VKLRATARAVNTEYICLRVYKIILSIDRYGCVNPHGYVFCFSNNSTRLGSSYVRVNPARALNSEYTCLHVTICLTL